MKQLNELTKNAQEKLSGLYRDMVKDAEEDFTGSYVIEFHNGGISEVEKRTKKDYPKD
ncbi:MAG: hypothetical protein K9L56_15065 [Clostridiales bacterium]|nr:hypothetical protein [Clostridiales bacterium]